MTSPDPMALAQMEVAGIAPDGIHGRQIIAAYEASEEPKTPDSADYDEYWDYDDSEECWNCGGEGFYASCVSEYACIDPESGCDLCIRTCDVCRGKGAL